MPGSQKWDLGDPGPAGMEQLHHSLPLLHPAWPGTWVIGNVGAGTSQPLRPGVWSLPCSSFCELLTNPQQPCLGCLGLFFIAALAPAQQMFAEPELQKMPPDAGGVSCQVPSVNVGRSEL